MKVRVPAYAPVMPPLIGQSANISSFFLAAAANSFEAIGEIVLVSTM
jgi:hypothetical protein